MPTIQTREIFYSIQGEGVYTGVPMAFVRLSGCSLHCTYCDTPYAQDPLSGESLDIGAILKKVTNLVPWQCSWVCITGGEPLDQAPELLYLIRELKRDSYKVEVETNGCKIKPNWWSIVDSWIPDMKCPSSGKDVWSRETEWYTNMRLDDQVKFVVGTEEDLKYTEEMMKRNRASNPWVLISPVLSSEDEWSIDKKFEEQKWLQRVVEFVKEMRSNSDKVRLSLQVHKFCYPRTKREV